jgi:uncharacterized RDD family membrane protein YckC
MKSLLRVLVFCFALLLFSMAGQASSITELHRGYLDGAIRSLHAVRVVKELLAHKFLISAADDEEDDADATPTPAKKKHHSENDTTVKIAGDFKLAKGESTNKDVVVIGGTVEIDGNINGDLVLIGSKGTFSGSANGDMVLIGTLLRIKPGATANGDLVSIGSDTPGSDRLKVNGDRTDLSTISPIAPFFTELVSNIFLLRPMSPTSMVGWTLAILALILRLAIAMAFPKPLAELNTMLLQRLAPSFLVGLALVIGGAILSSLLTITVVGILAIPFLALGGLLLGFFGRIVVSYSIGKLLFPRLVNQPYALPVWVIAGNVVLWILFCIPIIGFITYGIVAPLGLGVVAIYIADRYKASTPKQIANVSAATPSETVSPGTVPSEIVPPPVQRPVPEFGLVTTSYVVNQAAFLPRLAGNLIDLAIVYAILYSIHQTRILIPIWVAYRFGMYAWRSATLGEIVMNLRVQKANGTPLTGDYSASLIRALASLISLLPLGFGFIWILFNKEMQAWHDRISVSYVVRAPIL